MSGLGSIGLEDGPLQKSHEHYCDASEPDAVIEEEEHGGLPPLRGEPVFAIGDVDSL